MQIKEYNEIITECRKFLKNEITPHVLDMDRTPDFEWALSVWEKSHALDIPSLLLPEDTGGVGYPEVCGALVLDAIASECAGMASVYAHHFTASALMTAIPSEQHPLLLTPAKRADGKPVIGTVVFPTKSNEEKLYLKKRDGRLLLSGNVALAGNMRYAGQYFVFAEEDGTNQSITCVRIDKESQGVRVGNEAGLPGLKINPFMSMDFDDVEINPSDVLGGRGSAGELLKKATDAFDGFVAAMAMGTARAAFQKADAYARERYQFGNIIIQHQEIQRMLGSMLMKLKTGTSAVLGLYGGVRLNLPYASPDPTLAKAYCTGAALDIILDAIQIHGGYGYMHEYGVEKLMRDVKVLQLMMESTPRCHIRAIASTLKG